MSKWLLTAYINSVILFYFFWTDWNIEECLPSFLLLSHIAALLHCAPIHEYICCRHMLWKQTLTQFCNKIKGGFFCSRHQMRFSCSWCRITTPLFMPLIHIHCSIDRELQFAFIHVQGLTSHPAGVVLTFLWVLRGISPSTPGCIACAPPIRTLFKSVPSRLTHHLLISLPPRAPPLAALKLRCRVPPAGFFSASATGESFHSATVLRLYFPRCSALVTCRSSCRETERGGDGGYFFPPPMQNVLRRLHLGACHVGYIFGS